LMCLRSSRTEAGRNPNSRFVVPKSTRRLRRYSGTLNRCVPSNRPRQTRQNRGCGSDTGLRGFPHRGKYYVNDQAGDLLHYRRRRKLHDCLFMGNRLGVSQKFFVGPRLSVLPASNFPLRNPLPSRPALPSCLQALGSRSGSLGCRGARLLSPYRR